MEGRSVGCLWRCSVPLSSSRRVVASASDGPEWTMKMCLPMICVCGEGGVDIDTHCYIVSNTFDMY